MFTQIASNIMAKRRYFSWTLGSLKLYWHQNVPSYGKQIIWQTNFSLTSPQKKKKKKESLLINKPTKKVPLTRLPGFICLFLPIPGFIYFSYIYIYIKKKNRNRNLLINKPTKKK